MGEGDFGAENAALEHDMKPTIDLAVLGLGAMGHVHVTAAKQSPYVGRIYGYEPDAARAAQRGRELGVVATDDLGSILANPDIRLITIAAESPAHADLAVPCLGSGKAVMCEKPLGINFDEGKRIMRAWEAKRNFFQVGFELHYSKLYVMAKEWIDAGLIGAPLNIHCRYYCHEFHRNNTWRCRTEESLVAEKLSHYIDLACWYAGSPVAEVYAQCAPNVVSYFSHPDNHQISLKFANGALFSLNFVMYLAETNPGDPLLDTVAKQADDGHSTQYFIFGTKGAIETDVFNRRICRWEYAMADDGIVSRIVESRTWPREDDIRYFHNVHDQNIRIIELVAKGLPPDVDAREAFESMKVVFAAEAAAKDNRIVKMAEFV